MIFKGTGKTLKVVLSEGADIANAVLSIEGKLSANPTFYSGQRITVESKSGPIPDGASFAIKAVFARYGIACSVLDERSAAERAAALITQTMLREEDPASEKELEYERDEHEAAYSSATVYRGDVVPGKSLDFEGSALIMGDVLPGAKVRASGDVIITGIAGGSIHAGFPSDREAAIIAGGFAAGEYRVGDLKVELKELLGSAVSLFSIAMEEESLSIKEGDAGMIARKGGGN